MNKLTKQIIIMCTKCLWNSPVNWDNKYIKSRPNMRKNHIAHLESHEKLESGINSWWTNSNGSENPKRPLPKRLILTIDIHYSNDARSLGNLQIDTTLKNWRKGELTYVYRWYQYINQKWKLTENPITNDTNMQPGFRNGIWNFRMFPAVNEK